MYIYTHTSLVSAYKLVCIHTCIYMFLKTFLVFEWFSMMSTSFKNYHCFMWFMISCFCSYDVHDCFHDVHVLLHDVHDCSYFWFPCFQIFCSWCVRQFPYCLMMFMVFPWFCSWLCMLLALLFMCFHDLSWYPYLAMISLCFIVHVFVHFCFLMVFMICSDVHAFVFIHVFHILSFLFSMVVHEFHAFQWFSYFHIVHIFTDCLWLSFSPWGIKMRSWFS